MDNEPRPSSLSCLLLHHLVLALYLLAAIQLFHQGLQGASQSEGSESVPRLPVLYISARNPQGEPAKLTASDLEVKIKGKPVSIQALRLLGRPPLRYCLLFDRSGSQRKRWEQHLGDARTLLGSVQVGRDYGLLSAFNDNAYLDAEGADPQKLMNALSKIDARSSTALYDAVIACSNSLADSASPSELRVMFILSDGDDNDSHHSSEQALQSLVKSGIRVYAIGQKNTDDPPWLHTAATGINALKQFTEETGGKAYLSKGTYDVQAVAKDIFGQLSSVFAVSLSPTSLAPGNLVHGVELKCKAKNVSLNAPQEFYLPSR